MKLIEVRFKRTLYKYLAYRGRRNCAICRNILWDHKQPVDGAFCKIHNKKVFKFMNDRCKLDTPIGDLAREIVSDGKFPTKSENEIFKYLEIKSIAGRIHPLFLKFKNEYIKVISPKKLTMPVARHSFSNISGNRIPLQALSGCRYLRDL